MSFSYMVLRFFLDVYIQFNILLYKGYFPSSWTQGYIVPIHKKVSLSDVEI